MNLDPSKAPGSDDIPTRLLILSASTIAPCIHHLYTLSLQRAVFPDDWKKATITPIYKGRGSKQMTTNYRPISLLSVLSKVLERLVFNHLYKHLNKYLPNQQSGFRKKDSTSHQLARLVHHIAQGMDGGKTVLACFYDLSKAFDRVWHRGLLAKLHHLGIRDAALKWITSYLSERQQCVRISNTLSPWLPVLANISHGFRTGAASLLGLHN